MVGKVKEGGNYLKKRSEVVKFGNDEIIISCF
jgi:hypothetical protein